MVHVHRLTMAALAGLFIMAIVVVAGTRLAGAEIATENSTPQDTPTEHASPTKPAKVPAAASQANRLEPFDVLQIRVIGTIMDQPIDGFFLVELDGHISPWGRVTGG